ncbi:hypothetical protein JCM5350_006505 [Sporobolomyces pararoseus]
MLQLVNLAITSLIVGSTILVSGFPTNPKKRLTFKQRVQQSKVLSNSTCTPQFQAEMYNIFASGNDSAVWEWMPTFYSGDDSQGGEVFVSGTDSPEDGAYYFLPASLPSSNISTSALTNSASSASAFRLNLVDKAKGEHCIVAQDGRTLTTGSCQNNDSIFLVSCSTCASFTSNSTIGGSTCQIRSTVPARSSSSYCTSWAASSAGTPGVPGYGPVGLRACQTGTKGQQWDIRLAQ